MGCPQTPWPAENVIQERQAKGSQIHHDSLASVGSNFMSLTPGSLSQVYLRRAQFGKSFLMIINSIPCTQQSLRQDYIEILVKGK